MGVYMNKVKLTEICDFQGGAQPPKEEWSTEKYPGYIRMLQIRDFTQKERIIPEYIKLEKKLKLCSKDDVLIARYGASLGKILTGMSGAYNVAIMKTIPDEKILRKKYLYYYFSAQYFQNFLLNVGSRAAQAGFNKEDLQRLEINCPSLKVQDKIINGLDKVSKVIKIREKQLALLDVLTKSRFTEMFGDPVLNPKKWKTKGLSELGKCKNGMNFKAGESGVDIHCLGVGDFKDYSEINNILRLPMISLDKLPPEEAMLQDGDIVFVRSNGNKMLVGRCLVVFPGNIATTYSGFCIRYRKESLDVDTIYLVQLLKVDSIRNKMIGRGANIQNLNQQILGKLQIPLPPIELQNQFADFVKENDKSRKIALIFDRYSKFLDTIHI